MNENDVFPLSKPVEATVVGGHEIAVLPAGTVVAVVLVFGDPIAPVAYEVEAFLEASEQYVLATVDARDIQ